MATSSSFPLLLRLPPTPRTHRGGGSSSSGHLLRVAGNYSVGEEAARKEEEQQLLPVQSNFVLRRDEEQRRKMVRVKEKESDGSELKPLYDDGFGTKSLADYYAAAREVLVDPDGGPPRWFCPVECGAPVGGSPVLLFLPDIDGTGMGLILHHQSLGKVFEVRCLHIPLDDRTPFEGLVKLVENSVKDEHARSPSTPLYLLGDSFGGCLALAVAARNPHIDLVLILVNPATSFNKSQLPPFIPVLGSLPRDLQLGIPYALSLILGGPLKMAATRTEGALLSRQALDELLRSVSSLIPLLSDLTDKIRNDILLWKLELLKSGASYSNSRLHAVEAQVLMLISGNDNLLPSADEADRLWTKLKTRKVRYFKDSGHSLLLEDRINLITIIKGTCTYRRSRQFDYVMDYLPPTLSEFRKFLVQGFSLLRIATSPVFLSTLDDGRIVRGLSGIPNEGPVLFVGYHMLMGLELFFFGEQLLREKNIAIRALAHPYLGARPETSRQEFELLDSLIVFGGLPVSAKHIFKLFSTKSFILLYPGGSREAHHRKGEAYKLFWPDQPEFVRMAARFGATIVPFGVVGEDDVAELVFDYDDQMKIPYLKRWIEDHNKQAGGNIRAGMEGEVANQDMYFPGVIPKVPGRFYYLFGKPVETRGMGYLKDRDSANEVYLRIKSDVEGLISYLKTKREEDPYRSIVQRALSQYSKVDPSEVPTFEP